MASENNHSNLELAALMNEFDAVSEKIYKRIENDFKPEDENMFNFLFHTYVKQRYVICVSKFNQLVTPISKLIDFFLH